MATILETLQETFPDIEGIDDARNIAEALAIIGGTGSRGANAIADNINVPIPPNLEPFPEPEPGISN